MANKRAGVQEADLLFTQQTAIALNGAPADSLAFAPGAACVLIQWGWQVTVAINFTVTQPIITIDVADYDDATNRAQVGTYTFVTPTALGNAVTWQDFPTGVSNGIAVAEGRRIIIEHQIQGAGAPATGQCRVFVVFRMTGQ